MALRVKHKAVVQVSADTAGKKKRFWLEDDIASEVQTDLFQRQTSGDLSIADGVTEVLGFGDVQDCRGMYLEVDQQCEVYLNGSATPIPLRPPSGASPAVAKLLLDIDATSCSVKNVAGGGLVLTGVFVLWGDPTV